MKKSHLLGIIAIGLIIFVGIWILNSDEPRGRAEQEKFDLAGGPERVKRGFPQREIVDLASEYPEDFLRNGTRKEKKVALSFDDGPDDVYTVQILDILKEKDVQATFFIVGRRAEIFPEVVSRMVVEGHVVANHTWSHPDILKLSQDKILEELQKTDRIIKDLNCYYPKFFRPPYGSIDRETLELVTGEGYAIISWDVDSLDWKGLDATEVKTNILENVLPGSIILQHSAGGIGEDLLGTVEALPEIIDVLQKDGYEFVTLDELLGIDYQQDD